MTQGIVEAITEIQRLVSTIDGVRYAPIYPPDKLTQFPAALCFYDTGDITSYHEPNLKHLANFVLEVHIPDKSKARDIETLYGIGQSIYRLLMSPDNVKLSGAIDSIEPEGIQAEFGPLAYDSTLTIGWQFTINAKLIEATG